MSAAREEELNPYRVRLVYGWGGLARHLSSLGVHITGDVLESRRRRHG